MVVYNALTIERLEKDNKKRYKLEDYSRLEEYYQNKVQQIHIVGEYAIVYRSNLVPTGTGGDQIMGEG